MSNLDDMHENGVHDYLKFVKFGYGRAHRPRVQGHSRRLDGAAARPSSWSSSYDPVKPATCGAGSTTSA